LHAICPPYHEEQGTPRVDGQFDIEGMTK